jgi:hypothetical protein
LVMPSFVALDSIIKTIIKTMKNFLNNFLNKKCKERKTIRKLENLRTHLEPKQCLHSTKDFVL